MLRIPLSTAGAAAAQACRLTRSACNLLAARNPADPLYRLLAINHMHARRDEHAPFSLAKIDQTPTACCAATRALSTPPGDGSIEFNILLKAENEAADDEEAVSLPIADPDSLEQLVDPHEVIIPGEQTISVHFRYPLRHPVDFTCQADDPRGFTRLHLARFIQDTYARIYKEEEQQAGHPGYIPGMYNRAFSSGPYGIWGHDIGDLQLVGMHCIAPGHWGLIVDS